MFERFRCCGRTQAELPLDFLLIDTALLTLNNNIVENISNSAGNTKRFLRSFRTAAETVTSEGALEKVNERENCVGLKMEIV